MSAAVYSKVVRVIIRACELAVLDFCELASHVQPLLFGSSAAAAEIRQPHISVMAA